MEVELAQFMLPPFQELALEFDEANEQIITQLSRSLGVMSRIEAHVVHEGKRLAITTTDGDVETTELIASETKVELDRTTVEHINLGVVHRKLMEIAMQLRENQTRLLVELMNETTKRTGNVVDGRGQPMTNEMLFEIVEKMSHDFDDQGEPQFEILAHPDLLNRLRELDEEFNRDPQLQRRLKEILDKKRDEFRTREMDRTMVG